MLEALLYSALSCPDADALVIRIQSNRNLNDMIKIELVETVKDTVSECFWDAND